MHTIRPSVPVVLALSLLCGTALAQEAPPEDPGTGDPGVEDPGPEDPPDPDGMEDDPMVAFPSPTDLVAMVADAAEVGALDPEGPEGFLLPLVVNIQGRLSPEQVAYLTTLTWSAHDATTLAMDPVVRAMLDAFVDIASADQGQNEGQDAVMAAVLDPSFPGALGWFLTTVAPDVERGTTAPPSCTVSTQDGDASCAFTVVATTMVAAALDSLQAPGPGGAPSLGFYADAALATQVGLPDFDPEADDGSGDGDDEFDPQDVDPTMIPSGAALIAFTADAVQDGSLPSHPILGFLHPISAAVRTALPDVYADYLQQLAYQGADPVGLTHDPAIHALADALRAVGAQGTQNEGQDALMAMAAHPAFPVVIAQLVASSAADMDRGVHGGPGCTVAQDEQDIPCGFVTVVAAAVGAARDMLDLETLPEPVAPGEHADPELAYAVGIEFGEDSGEEDEEDDVWGFANDVVLAAIDGSLPERDDLAFLAFATGMAQGMMDSHEVGYLRDLAWTSVSPTAIAADPAVATLAQALVVLGQNAPEASGIPEVVAGASVDGYRNLLGLAYALYGAPLEAAAEVDCTVELDEGFGIPCVDVARTTIAMAASLAIDTMGDLGTDPEATAYADPGLAADWDL